MWGNTHGTGLSPYRSTPKGVSSRTIPTWFTHYMGRVRAEGVVLRGNYYMGYDSRRPYAIGSIPRVPYHVGKLLQAVCIYANKVSVR